jgi:sugar-specific transcriptional regulator TrmB
MFKETLVKIGLTSTEAKIYEALLSHGTLKTSEILKETKMNSGRIYDILANLQNKGFISTTTENGIKKFKAAPPHIIEEYLKEQESQIKEKQLEISKLLPSLEKIYGQNKEETKVEVYIGSKGMRTAYEILFKEADKDKNLYVTGITKQANYTSWLPTLLKTFIYPTRQRLRLKTKKIMNEEARKEEIWHTDKSEIRYLPLTALTSYEILGNIVIIQVAQEETINLVIKSKQVADDFREQFNLLWKSAKK